MYTTALENFSGPIYRGTAAVRRGEVAKPQQQGISAGVLESYEEQCNALARDWKRMGGLIDQCRDPNANREQLEGDFLALRSSLSCDYPILTYWRKGGFGLTAGINRMLSGSPTLADLVESAGANNGHASGDWQSVWNSLEKVLGALAEARRTLNAGGEAHLPAELIQHDTHVPFPIKKVLAVLGAAVAVVAILVSVYFMRNFLGFWAPGAGDGIVVTEGMGDEEQIESILMIMSRAFRQNDVDLFMTVIADDFADEEGNSKRALRIALQAYKETGEFGQVSVDWSRMRVTERGELLDARPVYIVTPDDKLVIYLGFRAYGGKLLVVTGSAA